MTSLRTVLVVLGLSLTAVVGQNPKDPYDLSFFTKGAAVGDSSVYSGTRSYLYLS